jgi:hypothetical protein
MDDLACHCGSGSVAPWYFKDTPPPASAQSRNFLRATSWANSQDTSAYRRECSGASRMIRPTRASSRPGRKNRIAGSSPSRRSSSVDGQQIEPAATAAKFPPEAVLILSEAFLTAELLEAMGMPDEPEGPLARVTPFRHATGLAIFSIRFKSMFCVAPPIALVWKVTAQPSDCRDFPLPRTVRHALGPKRRRSIGPQKGRLLVVFPERRVFRDTGKQDDRC